MKSIVYSYLFLFLNVLVYSETTPLDQVLKEDGVTLIAVDFKVSENKIKSANMEKFINGTYHYNVYVPAGYNTNKDRKYACLFIASPGGNAELGNVKNWVKSKEWIVVMLVESKNGDTPWPAFSNFVSAHDDAVKRLRIQNGFKFGTGYSGGARVSSNFAKNREGFAGIILQGAGFGGSLDSGANNKNLTVYAIIGKKDDNYYELAQMEKGLPEYTIHKMVENETGHQWADEEEMTKGLNWTINLAFKKTRMSDDNKPFIMSYREKQWKDANQLPTGLEKVSQLEELSEFIKASHITSLAGEEEIGKKVSSLIIDLKKDPVVVKEIGAENSFRSTQAAEKNLRVRLTDKKQLAGQINPIYQQYASIAKKYPDTEYGKKAQSSADALKAEFFGDKK